MHQTRKNPLERALDTNIPNEKNNDSPKKAPDTNRLTAEGTRYKQTHWKEQRPTRKNNNLTEKAPDINGPTGKSSNPLERQQTNGKITTHRKEKQPTGNTTTYRQDNDPPEKATNINKTPSGGYAYSTFHCQRS